jgi:hypothetical protein
MMFVSSSLSIRIPMTFLNDNMDEHKTIGHNRFHTLRMVTRSLQWIYIQGPSVILAYDLTDKTKLLGIQIM